ncbi:hypothetical protein [Serinicoccus hydrothermalis]|uniref:hypothetical protein n=1 Tax=Serinicoccus hydrothermalis TaxID=1758689 RepID=UPI0012F87E41|nr:hypothetical protein [Serinicoccus hydrothermalis]
MIDIQVAVMKLFEVAIGETVHAGHRWLGARSAKADARAVAYQEFTSRIQRAHVRLNLLHAVVAGRRRRLAVVPAITGYRVHVEMVDRLADDLVGLSRAWEAVATIGSPKVVEKGQELVDALTTLATDRSAQSHARGGFKPSVSRARKALEAKVVIALDEFRAAASTDLA